jgi:hypothetical protein
MMNNQKPFWWKYASPTLLQEYKSDNAFRAFCVRKGYTDLDLIKIYESDNQEIN